MKSLCRLKGFCFQGLQLTIKSFQCLSAPLKALWEKKIKMVASRVKWESLRSGVSHSAVMGYRCFGLREKQRRAGEKKV